MQRLARRISPFGDHLEQGLRKRGRFLLRTRGPLHQDGRRQALRIRPHVRIPRPDGRRRVYGRRQHGHLSGKQLLCRPDLRPHGRSTAIPRIQLHARRHPDRKDRRHAGNDLDEDVQHHHQRQPAASGAQNHRRSVRNGRQGVADGRSAGREGLPASRPRAAVPASLPVGAGQDGQTHPLHGDARCSEIRSLIDDRRDSGQGGRRSGPCRRDHEGQRSHQLGQELPYADVHHQPPVQAELLRRETASGTVVPLPRQGQRGL